MRFARIFWRTQTGLRKTRQLDPMMPDQRRQLHAEMENWARDVLQLLRVEARRLGEPERNEPVIYVGNHISYLDIPLLMSMAPVVFVAKRQVGTWPIIGSACRSVGTLFVDRESRESRNRVGETIAPQMRQRQQSIAVFPSGTTCDRETQPWKWGAFQIAHRHHIRIQPFRLRYDPMRAVAYLKQDLFVPHLLAVLRQHRLQAEIEFHPPVEVTDPAKDCAKWADWVREGLEPAPEDDATSLLV